MFETFTEKTVELRNMWKFFLAGDMQVVTLWLAKVTTACQTSFANNSGAVRK